MKIQFAVLWILLLLCLSTFMSFGQNSQPIEPLKPKKTLVKYDSDFKPKEILVRYDNDVTNYRSYHDEWFLTRKSNLSHNNQILFNKPYRRYEDKWSLTEKDQSDSKQLNTKSSNFKYEAIYFEIPIGLMRTFTSRGDYGNLYFMGLGFTGISYRFDFNLTFFAVGWGRTAKDVQYYHEIWSPRSKTFGTFGGIFEFGYDISPIKDIRFSPMIGFATGSELGPRSKDKKKYSGLEKYFIEELLIPQVGFDTYFFNHNNTLIKLKYRYTNLSIKNNKFSKDLSINKHIITLGINFSIEIA